MAPTASTLRCRILELPAELRNHIYRDSLCEEDEIFLAGACYQPPLLRTCRQIRQEAASVYYKENEFRVSAIGFNPSVVLAFERQARAVVQFANARYFVIVNSRKYSWSGLKLWLKAFFDDQVESMIHEDGNDTNHPYYMAVKAFDMVALLKEDLDWSKIEKVLEKYKEATVGVMQWE